MSLRLFLIFPKNISDFQLNQIRRKYDLFLSKVNNSNFDFLKDDERCYQFSESGDDSNIAIDTYDLCHKFKLEKEKLTEQLTHDQYLYIANRVRSYYMNATYLKRIIINMLYRNGIEKVGLLLVFATTTSESLILNNIKRISVSCKTIDEIKIMKMRQDIAYIISK